VLRERVELVGKERREAAVGRAPLDLDHFAFGQVAAHRIPRSHQLARQAVENLEALDIRRREPRDARGLVLVALLVDEGAGIGEVARRVLDLAQPGEGFRRLRYRRARCQDKRHRKSCGDAPDVHLFDSPGRSATVRT
jgi:hypothetical protein